MKHFFIIPLLWIGISAHCQKILKIEGKTFSNSDSVTWLGVNIPRAEPTRFIFKNNQISSVNKEGYLLQAGDERVYPEKVNNLDGADLPYFVTPRLPIIRLPGSFVQKQACRILFFPEEREFHYL
jgi:hypothetical protein